MSNRLAEDIALGLREAIALEDKYKEGYEAGKRAIVEQIFADLEHLLIYDIDWIASISYSQFAELKEKYGVK